LKPALVDNLSAGAPTWDANGNLTAGFDIIAGGNHDGRVGLTINDGYGNANLTFNHHRGVPDRDGSSARIAVSVDSNQEVMDFQLKGSVTAGTPVTLTSVLKLYDDNIQLLQATTCLTPTQNTHVARKDYVDDLLATKATTASVTAVSQSLTNHLGATTSHAKAQVGLSNVNNTSDANKPISTATQTALDGKIGESEINTSHFTFASNTLSLNTIVEGQIGTGAVTATKIGTGAVTELKIGTGAVTPSKLSTGAPTWTDTGQMVFDGNIYTNQVIGREAANGLILRADPESPLPTTGGPQIQMISADAGSTANQIYVKSSFVYFDTVATTPARFAGINPNGPTDDKDLTTKEYVDTAIESQLENTTTAVSLTRAAEFKTSSESYQDVPLSASGQPDYFTDNGDDTFTILEGNYLMWFSFLWKTEYTYWSLELKLTTVSGMADFAGIGVFKDASSQHDTYSTFKTQLLDAAFRYVDQPTTFALQIRDEAYAGSYDANIKDVTLTILKV
jgi:hypothetical protein